MKLRDSKDLQLRKLLMKRDVKLNRHKSRKGKQKHSLSKNERKLRARNKDLNNKQPLRTHIKRLKLRLKRKLSHLERCSRNRRDCAKKLKTRQKG